MITFEHSGNFDKTEKFFAKMTSGEIYRQVERFAREGVDALAAATPRDTGETANLWRYGIIFSKTGVRITWYNGNVEDGVPIAIILQYGHGTGTGGFVQGRDYINPAMKPIFDRIAEDVWKAVKSA
jgi:hypothetical protein